MANIFISTLYKWFLTLWDYQDDQGVVNIINMFQMKFMAGLLFVNFEFLWTQMIHSAATVHFFD